jgi:allantoate deiminase
LREGEGAVSRLLEDIAELRTYGADGQGVTRLAWSKELEAALDWCAGLMAEAGLEVERDAAGNLIGRWEADPGPAVLTGSHLDTVPSGGGFDGALGVLGAIDAVRSLRASGMKPERPIWVAAFMDEEGVRFGASMLGSRAFAGEDVSALGERVDPDGVSVREAMRAAGRDFDAIGNASAIGGVGVYLELHVEQGPVLERAGADLGVVGEITGMAGLRFELTGRARHAGSTPMDARSDALVGAARFVTELRDAARAQDSLRATVGSLTVGPGAANVIPGSAALSVDVRSETEAGLDSAVALVRDLSERIAREEGLTGELTELYRHPPLPMDAALIELLEGAARETGATAMRLSSGAAHDASVIGRHVPAGMLFVPSHDGISHAPDEHSEGPACELGARALANALRRLAGGDAMGAGGQ